MIESFFLVCAAIGGTLLVLRLVLAVLGFGLGELGHLDDVSGLHDDGHDLSFHHSGDDGQWHVGKVLSIQAIVAFLTFFGVGGLSALEGGATTGSAAAVAFATGLAAMLVLVWFLGLLRKLQSDGTLRLADAVGCPGRVYLTVPAHDGGVGKVSLVLQGRSVEVEARTPGPELRSGEEVVVARVLDDRTVEVVDLTSRVVKPVSLHG